MLWVIFVIGVEKKEEIIEFLVFKYCEVEVKVEEMKDCLR